MCPCASKCLSSVGRGVFKPKAQDLCFFPVDNSKSLDKHGVNNLQQAILDMVQDSLSDGIHKDPKPLLYVKLLDMLKADGQEPYLKVQQARVHEVIDVVSCDSCRHPD